MSTGRMNDDMTSLTGKHRRQCQREYLASLPSLTLEQLHQAGMLDQDWRLLEPYAAMPWDQIVAIVTERERPER